MTTSSNSDGSPRPFEIDTNVEWFFSELAADVLPVRCNPLPDELLSSWLVRLAWLNAEKLYTFRQRFWPFPGSPWGQDLDLIRSDAVRKRIAEISLRTPESLSRCLLNRYAGILFEADDPKGLADGILVRGQRGAKILGNGVQLCPECMREGLVPYFRSCWRVSYLVLCTRHRRLLLDSCPSCGRPIAYNFADFGRALLPERIPTSFCAFCGLPWSSAESLSQLALEDDFCDWQGSLHGAIETGWLTGSIADPLYALSFFNGLRALIRVVAGNDTRGVRLREQASADLDCLPLGVAHSRNGSLFSGLRLGDRLYVLRYVHWLLKGWPDHFLRAAKAAGLRISYIDYYQRRAPLPYWLASVLELTRDHRHSKVSPEERESVRRFLGQHGRPVSTNEVNRLLGRWYVSRNKRY